MQPIHWKTRLWHQWKTLRNVPFRRSWFVGYDLDGNSYWELKDHNNPFRYRRKVEPGRKMHIGEYKACPQWMQWLRHTRPTAPTMEELLADQQRIARIRLLAQEADKRWKSVPLKGSTTTGDDRLASAWVPGVAPKHTEPEHSFEGNFTGDDLAARMYSAENKIKQQEHLKNAHK